MSRRASPKRRSLIGVTALLCLAGALPAGAQILRLGVDRVTLGWTPPDAGIVHGYGVLVSRNGGPDTVEAFVSEPEVTLGAGSRDVLVVKVFAVGQVDAGAAVIASAPSPPSLPIYFVPALTWPSNGLIALQCAECGSLRIRGTSNTWGPFDIPSIPDAWSLEAIGRIASSNSLEKLWRDDETGELRVVPFGESPDLPLAVSAGDLREFEVLGLAEIDGDPMREILLRHESGSPVQFWKVAGGSIVRAGEILAPSMAAYAGAADQDGDGISEIWWQGSQPGRIEIWKVGLDRIVGLLASIETPAAGDLVRIADFDGDGATDALWNEGGVLAITYLTAAAGGVRPRLDSTLTFPALAASLEVLATAEVDGTPGADILLQDRTTRRVFAIAPAREDLPLLVAMFDVEARYEIVYAQ